MPAARLWRITGIDPWGGAGLELSALHLYDGTGRVDAGATLSCSHAPTTGTLAALQDANSGTLCAFDSGVVRSAGFWLQWDMGAGNTADVWGLRVGAGAAQDAFLATCFLQYFDGSKWVAAECGAYPWPGVGAVTATPVSAVVFDAEIDTWAPLTAAGSRQWYGAAMSADGQKIIGAEGIGYLHLSLDGGTTWAPLTAAGSRQWHGAAMSADGQKIVGAVQGSYLHLSLDGGATWAQITAAGSRSWRDVAMSADGQKIVGAVQSDYLRLSLDGGTTWVQITAAGSRNWFGAAMSADGQKIIGADGGSYLHLSLDGGTTWAPLTAAGSRPWRNVAMSADGQKILAAVGGDYLHWSLDGGTTWVRIVAAGSRQWLGAAMSADGARVVAAWGAATLHGGLFRSSEFAVPPLRTTRPPADTVFTRPTGNLRTIAAQRQRLARDIAHGGSGTIRDTVELKATPSNAPLRRRVRLYSDRSGEKARETWSDAATGIYEFTGLDTAQQFTALAVDHERVHQAVAADNLTPKVLP